ncbi:MAG TPA: radical SAM protein [bacterium]|nr:radical SAM protein [bacterium]HPR86760.1 radical SAM protein [bacterium]
MRVLLINPPFLPRFCRSHRVPAVEKSGNLHYPHWLALAGAVLDARSHSIWLYDCPADDITLEGILARAVQFDPDLILLESSTPSWYADCETAQALREQLPHARICMTGTHVTALWRETLERAPAIDYIALGEYEESVADLADILEAGVDDRTVPGIAARSHLHSGRPEERPLNEELDKLPFVSPIYQRFLTPAHYTFNLSRHPFVQIMAGRGCTAACFFCAYPQIVHGQNYRHRTAENIVREMLWIQKNMPEVRQINFEDENFGVDPAFARRLGEVAQVREVHLPIFANISANLDSASLDALKAAGLHNCTVGFDTSRYSLLEKMQKLQTDKSIATFMQAARRHGILVHGCFLVGFPGETLRTMREAYDWARRIRPDSAQFTPLMPYPGTGAWRYFRYHGYLATLNFRDWLTRTGWSRCVLNLPGLTPKKIDRFCERATLLFHLRPLYLARKLDHALRHPAEGLRSLRAGWQLIRYFRFRRLHPEPSLRVRPLAVSATWRMMPEIPDGRMQVIEKASQRLRAAEARQTDHER